MNWKYFTIQVGSVFPSATLHGQSVTLWTRDIHDAEKFATEDNARAWAKVEGIQEYRVAAIPVAYSPRFLSWCKSFEQECAEMRELIEAGTADEKMLRAEYRELTGKRFRAAKK